MKAIHLAATLPFLLLSGCQDKPAADQATANPDNGMVLIPAGTFKMGAEPGARAPRSLDINEGPIHEVEIDAFWIDATEVTNAQFREFVEATGYKTVAETAFKQEDFPDAPPEALVPMGFVFYQAETPVDPQTAHHSAWMKMVPGADWQHPDGPGSNIDGKDDHPVVCITHPDALAYAEWAGKRLPTEAEWEYASRGGLEGKLYPWGDELRPDGKFMANLWQGGFPNINTAEDGFDRTAPVKSFPPNGYGLYDMAGNVWEIVNDLYHKDYYTNSTRYNPQGPKTSPGRDPENPDAEGTGQFPEHVVRGGSYISQHSHCRGYRNAARQTRDDITATNLTGFRCAKDAAPEGASPKG